MNEATVDKINDLSFLTALKARLVDLAGELAHDQLVDRVYAAKRLLAITTELSKHESELLEIIHHEAMTTTLDENRGECEFCSKK